MDASSLLKDLECPICLHVLTDPVVLPACGHSLCTACLKRLLTGNSRDVNVAVKCPFRCARVSSVPSEGLPKAYQLAGVIESLKALCSPAEGSKVENKTTQLDSVSLDWSSLSVVTTTSSNGVENRAYMGQDRSVAFDEMCSVILRSCVKAITIKDSSFPTVSISPEQWERLIDAVCGSSVKEVSFKFIDFRELTDIDFLRLLESKDTKKVSIQNSCLLAPSVLNRLKAESSKKKLRISEVNNRFMNHK